MKVLINSFGVAALATLVLIPSTVAAEDSAALKNLDPSTVAAEDSAALKNPVPYTAKSIAKGKLIYAQNCANCHGEDGQAQIDVISVATDLTSPEMYYFGISEGEIFDATRNGCGEGMPPYSFILTDEEIWHSVNFMLSLWPADQRPAIED